MSKQKVSDKDIILTMERSQSVAEAARSLGLDPSTIYHRWKRLAPTVAKVDKPAAREESIDGLLSRRKKEYTRLRDHEEKRKRVPVTFATSDPIAIVWLGDLHLDSPGTDLQAIERICKLAVESEGVYLAHVGDVLDLWKGKLSHLYAQSVTTRSEGFLLLSWWLGMVHQRLLFWAGGNHDQWADAEMQLRLGEIDGLYQNDEIRFKLQFPKASVIKGILRHEMPGSSIYHAAQGPLRELVWGPRDNLAVAGHKHAFGYLPLVNPEHGGLQHALQVGSFKRYDDFGRRLGLRDKNIAAYAVTVIDPSRPDTDLHQITPWWNLEDALGWMEHLRSKRR